MCSVCRNTVLEEDKKKLARDHTHDRQYLLSQQHVTAVCVINVHLRIDEYQVLFLEPRHAHDLLEIERIPSESIAR